MSLNVDKTIKFRDHLDVVIPPPARPFLRLMLRSYPAKRPTLRSLPGFRTLPTRS
jgi:hypothetical protein